MRLDGRHLTLCGCGKMGSAMLRGWLAHNLLSPEHITIIDPGDLPPDFQNLAHIKGARDLPQNHQFDILVLAVKPQIMDEICTDLRPYVSEKTMVISIAAGKPLAFFAEQFGAQQPVVRVMPNIPAAVGKGMSALVAAPAVDEAARTAADILMNATGKTVWLDDESLMDAVTAISGSGPAYVFLLMEVMAEAGRRIGLPEEMAAQLARQTVIGSTALAEALPETTPATLRENVTSPGGTTAAALEVLMQDRALQYLFNDAIEAAARRGKELAE